ncbi:hypothetical protein GJU43_14560 [Flavobacterium sp. LC2016-23]|uniref:glycine zipper family protein n=1 Tax=Flavobacterium sp. LC2016-23 TaxID=2666330 RepID=UPI0012AF66CF|nr:glycine zipper family protein [Flavobacterium sp. LC2016-23]MRX40508.1 hypothetical protein [Flavobacterium sp. LC2016-23]
MKKILLITLLLFISLLNSCSTNDPIKQESPENIDYAILNKSIDNQINIFHKIHFNEDNIDQYLKYFKTVPAKEMENKNIPKETTIKITLAPHYNNKESQFMLSFYQNLVNCYDNKIIVLLNSKRISLNEGGFSSEFKEETNFIFNTIEKTTNEISNILNKSQINRTGKSSGFGDCVAKQGKNIGRAVATGALVGAVSGAITGATVGTVSLPGVGTATGIVAGAVFGAAKGAVGSGLTTFAWVLVDCVMERKESKILHINYKDLYNDILLANDSDKTDSNIFDNSDSLINTVLLADESTTIKFIK